MTRTALLSTSLVLVLAAASQAQTKLERKFTEGDKYTQESYFKIEQTLSIAGMDVESSVETNITAQSEVGKRDATGELKVKEKIASLNITTKAQGTEYNFDSANPDNKGTSPLEAVRGIHKSLVASTTTTVLDAQNNITAVEREQGEFNSLPAETQALVQSEFDPDNMKQRAEEAAARIPSGPVKVGDTWNNTESVNFGAGQSMTFEFEYSYVGTTEQDGKTLDKITRKATSAVFMLDPGSPLPLTVKSSDLKAEDLGSVSLFDRQVGRFIDDKLALRVTGDLAFEVNGMPIPAKLDLKMETNVTSRPQ